MQYYLIRHAETDTRAAVDPYNHPLSTHGQAQAAALAQLCRDWGVGLLVTSMMMRSMQTADAVSALLPNLERWDLTDLEDLSVDDLMGDPTASHLAHTWTPQQVQIGLARLWIRVMAVMTRVQITAEARGLASVAIIASERVLRLILLNWRDQDWSHYDERELTLAPGAVCRATVDDDSVALEWLPSA